MNVRKLLSEIKQGIIKESDRQGIVTIIRDSLKDVYGTNNKYKGQIKKNKYKIPNISTQNVDVTQDNPDEEEED